MIIEEKDNKLLIKLDFNEVGDIKTAIGYIDTSKLESDKQFNLILDLLKDLTLWYHYVSFSGIKA